MIEENLACVINRIRQAKERSGRLEEEIILVGVTKNVAPELIERAIKAGLKDIGEIKVLEAQEKFEKIASGARWHMVGHLQTNKAKQAVKMFDLIHSVDSQKLAKILDEEAKQINKVQDILVEVNTTGEPTKYGINPNEVSVFLKSISVLKNIKVKGLMTMAPETEDPQTARPFFAMLRELKEKIKKENIPSIDMEYLSMGMSQDFEVAIEEGANILRIGRAIFYDKE